MNTKHTEAFLSWCAGLFDGEGWLYTKVSSPADRPRKRLTLVAGMTNTETALLEPLLVFGGKLRVHGGTALSRKTCFEWRIYSAQAERFLRLIAPHLRGAKAQKVSEALELRRTLVFARKRSALGQFVMGVMA